MNAVYTGTITLGVLNIPIQLFSCVTEERIGFKQISPCHHSPIEQRTYCRDGGELVQRADLLKGYETEKDKYVILTPDEITAAALPISKVVEIEVCVPESALDFRLFDKPYVALPPKKDPGRLYALLHAALASTGHVAIGRIVIRTRQSIAAVRVLGNVLVVQLMYWPDEVTDLAAFPRPEVEVKAAELRLAETLVRQMAGEFDAARFVDQYRENLLKIIEARARGEEVTFREKVPAASAETDIMALLAASIAAVEERRSAA